MSTLVTHGETSEEEVTILTGGHFDGKFWVPMMLVTEKTGSVENISVLVTLPI